MDKIKKEIDVIIEHTSSMKYLYLFVLLAALFNPLYKDLNIEISVLLFLGIILLIIISAFYFLVKTDTKKVPKTLTEKYGILVSFQGLAYLTMVVSTGLFIYGLIQFFDAPKEVRKMFEYVMIISTFTYFIGMFSIFCLTKIIDFLFDLDSKIDK